MDDTFRSAQEPVADQAPPSGVPATSGGEVDVEVPYLDYEASSGHPFLVDHYNLGDSWADPMGGFPKEVENLEEYVSDQIRSGEIANSAADVKGLIKRLEKMTNVDKESRPVVKIEILSAYVDFLRRTDSTRKNLRRYGNR